MPMKLFLCHIYMFIVVPQEKACIWSAITLCRVLNTESPVPRSIPNFSALRISMSLAPVSSRMRCFSVFNRIESPCSVSNAGSFVRLSTSIFAEMQPIFVFFVAKLPLTSVKSLYLQKVLGNIRILNSNKKD